MPVSLPDISDPLVAGAVAAAFVGGLARGFSGFGGALIMMPPAAAVLGPSVAASAVLLFDFVLSLPYAVAARRDASFPQVGLMLAGAFVGTPLGAYALAHSDPVAMRWAIAAIVGLMLVILVTGYRYRGRPAPPVTVAVGVAGGVLGGAAQLTGPPIVAYLMGTMGEPRRVRGTIMVLFAATGIITAVNYLFQGVLDGRSVGAALVLGPLYGVGMVLGARLFGLASPETFRKVVYGLIVLAALLSLPVLDPWLRPVPKPAAQAAVSLAITSSETSKFE